MHGFILILFLNLCVTATAQPSIQDKSGLDESHWQERVTSQSVYDKLARRESEGHYYALPYLLFVIDRAAQNSEPQVYFINTQRYALHRDFLHANYLSLDRGQEFYQRHYREPNRRFLLGSIAYHSRADKFTFEFQSVDLLTPELILETYAKLSKSFFAPLFFQPNSAQHTGAVVTLHNLPQFSANEPDETGNYLPLHQARNVGVLRILDQITDDTILDRNEIVIFREPPLTLTPVSGVITIRAGVPLAHVNLLAKSWKIPNAYIRDADKKFASLNGKFVWFEVSERSFTLRQASVKETAEHGQQAARESDLRTPEVDLNYRNLTNLRQQQRRDAVRFGAKSANLGEVMRAAYDRRVMGVSVPPGFSIPFFYYDQFIRENHLDNEITEMLGNERFNHDPVYRRERLRELREKIQRGRINPNLEQAVKAKTRAVFGDIRRCGVFARSSTNAEDLPDFSGAGLYTSVPNIRSETVLIEAIRTVWASLWNYAAYEARESAGINHAAVYAAVLVQKAMNADAAGVLITRNVFNPEDRDAVYINAKRGLGMRVVEGRSVPEQIICHLPSGAVKVLMRSADDTMLKFDERGGVRETKADQGRAVLTETTVRRLARVSLQIRRIFAAGNQNMDQDIEWLMIGNHLYIVQSRPYISETGK